MKAQILYGIGNIKYAEIDKPLEKAGKAVVRVSKCGICGSDIPRIYKTGAHNMPIVPGHEFMGVVEKCRDLPGIVGKRVGIFPLIPCMECGQCKLGNYEMCSNYNYLGSRCDGGFAEYVSVPLWNLLPLADEISDEAAAMLEPMSVAVHAMRRANAEEKKDASIVVCGLGTIGLLLSMFLKDAGCNNILFVGNKDIQKKKILEMGFNDESYCDVRYGEPLSFIKKKTEGRGADVYFECIGRSESYAQAVSAVAPLGKVVLIGNPASDMELPREVYWKILRGQLCIIGNWNSSFRGRDAEDTEMNPEPDDWRYVISRLGKKALSPEILITHRFDLEGMTEGLDIMRKKSEEYIKIMIECNKKTFLYD